MFDISEGVLVSIPFAKESILSYEIEIFTLAQVE